MDTFFLAILNHLFMDHILNVFFFKDMTLDEVTKHLIEPPCININSSERTVGS